MDSKRRSSEGLQQHFESATNRSKTMLLCFPWWLLNDFLMKSLYFPNRFRSIINIDTLEGLMNLWNKNNKKWKRNQSQKNRFFSVSIFRPLFLALVSLWICIKQEETQRSLLTANTENMLQKLFNDMNWFHWEITSYHWIGFYIFFRYVFFRVIFPLLQRK